MAEIRTKPYPVVKTAPTHHLGVPATRVASVVDRTSELSNEVPKPARGGRAGRDRGCGAVPGQIEEALPQQVAGTFDVAKTITESGLEMADRLHTEYDVLRNVIDSAAKSLSSRDAAKPKAAQ